MPGTDRDRYSIGAVLLGAAGPVFSQPRPDRGLRMRKQRRAQSRAPTLDAGDSAKIEGAIKNERERLVDRALGEADIDAQRVVLREQNEFLQALRRLRQNVADNHRGWTWNLLAVLDWDEHDLRHNELLDQGSTESLVTADERRRQEDSAWLERGDRLRSLLAAFLKAQAQGDLTWAAGAARGTPDNLRTVDLDEQQSTPPLLIRRDDALRTLALSGEHALCLAVEAYDLRDKARAKIDRWHKLPRHYCHVHASVLRILAEVLGLVHQQGKHKGKINMSDLAHFIDDQNDIDRAISDRPCRGFAGAHTAGCYGKIRTILSRY